MEADTSFKIETSECLECGGKITFIKEKGEIVCNRCGLIISEKNVDNFNSRMLVYNQEEIKKTSYSRHLQDIFSDIQQSMFLR